MSLACSGSESFFCSSLQFLNSETLNFKLLLFVPFFDAFLHGKKTDITRMWSTTLPFSIFFYPLFLCSILRLFIVFGDRFSLCFFLFCRFETSEEQLARTRTRWVHFFFLRLSKRFLFFSAWERRKKNWCYCTMDYCHVGDQCCFLYEQMFRQVQGTV